MPTDTFKPPTQQDPATAEWEQDFFDIHGRRAGQVDYDDWQWSRKFVELEGRPITREDWQRHYFEDKSLGQRLTSPGAKYSSVPEFAPRISRIEGDMPADQWLEITPDPWYTTMDISTPEGRFRQFDAWDQKRNQHARGTPEYDLITLSMNQLMTAGPGSAPWQFNFSRRQGMRDEIDELTKNLTDEQRVAFIDDWVDSKLALGINPYSFNHPNVQMAPAIAATIEAQTASDGAPVVPPSGEQVDLIPSTDEFYRDTQEQIEAQELFSQSGPDSSGVIVKGDTVWDDATNTRVLLKNALKPDLSTLWPGGVDPNALPPSSVVPTGVEGPPFGQALDRPTVSPVVPPSGYEGPFLPGQALDRPTVSPGEGDFPSAVDVLRTIPPLGNPFLPGQALDRPLDGPTGDGGVPTNTVEDKPPHIAFQVGELIREKGFPLTRDALDFVGYWVAEVPTEAVTNLFLGIFGIRPSGNSWDPFPDYQGVLRYVPPDRRSGVATRIEQDALWVRDVVGSIAASLFTPPKVNIIKASDLKEAPLTATARPTRTSELKQAPVAVTVTVDVDDPEQTAEDIEIALNKVRSRRPFEYSVTQEDFKAGVRNVVQAIQGLSLGEGVEKVITWFVTEIDPQPISDYQRREGTRKTGARNILDYTGWGPLEGRTQPRNLPTGYSRFLRQLQDQAETPGGR